MGMSFDATEAHVITHRAKELRLSTLKLSRRPASASDKGQGEVDSEQQSQAAQAEGAAAASGSSHAD